MVLLLFVFLIVGEAVYEGTAHAGNKTLAKIFELLVRGITLVIIVLWLDGKFFNTHIEFWHGIGGYVFLRIALFRMVWNFTAGEEYLFIGTTSPYDKLLHWICFKSPVKAPPAIFLPTIEVMSLLYGLSLCGVF